MRALVVDDDFGIRTVVHRILREYFPDLSIDVCEDGIQALRKLSDETYGVVLLDLRMPVLTGLEVLESMRRSTTHRPVPVVVMSGIHDESIVRRVATLGVSEYLSKPFRPTHFVERVTRVLAEAACREEAPVRHPSFPPLTRAIKSRALIADGDEQFRHFVRRSLAGLCYVETAPTGLTAIEYCLHRRPDVLFIGGDLGLVDRDILVRTMREHAQFRAIRMVAVAQGDELSLAVRSGIYDAVVPRTYTEKVFLRALEPLFEHSELCVRRAPTEVDADETWGIREAPHEAFEKAAGMEATG